MFFLQEAGRNSAMRVFIVFHILVGDFVQNFLGRCMSESDLLSQFLGNGMERRRQWRIVLFKVT